MNYFHLGLAALMLVTGSINTLSVKWADTMKSESSDGVVRGFNHPFLQACGMFLGEMSCMAVFFLLRWIKRRRGIESLSESEESNVSWNPLVLFPAALMDMTATSIQYIALNLTYASSFQMLRGAVIIFTGLLSRIFLRRKLSFVRWIGILFVIGGLVVVGLCDTLYPKGSVTQKEGKEWEDEGKNSSDVLIGDILIISAQIIVGSQMVYEEKFISTYNIPALQVVGWEGAFGFLTLSALLIPMNYIHVSDRFSNNPRHVLEDVYDGVYQLAHNPLLLTSFSTTILSIGFFNFAGISVTKEMSATTRMVLDSLRTLVIWAISLLLHWETFHALQLLGFSFLLIGMCIYNNIIIIPCIQYIAFKIGLTSPPYEDLRNDELSASHESLEDHTTVYETPNQRPQME